MRSYDGSAKPSRPGTCGLSVLVITESRVGIVVSLVILRILAQAVRSTIHGCCCLGVVALLTTVMSWPPTGTEVPIGAVAGVAAGASAGAAAGAAVVGAV